MKTVELNELNPTLRIAGSESTRSMDIKNLTVKKWPGSDARIKLIVLDEKNIPIFSQVLDPNQAEDVGAVEVNKKFVFYDHLSVVVTAEPAESPFAVEIEFE